jgi:hypothetical protein
MQRIMAVVMAALAMSLSASGQFTGLKVEVELEETIFLPGEEIPVGVRVSNLSGQTVSFGETDDWLRFHVETRDGEIVDRFAEAPVYGPFTLETAKAGKKWWNIQPYFELEERGEYVVYVEVRVPEWNTRVLSSGRKFTIQPARKLWEVAFGVPPKPGSEDSTPEIRRYALQSATRSSERKLYARVSDASDSQIYRVVMLDRLLSFSKPQQQLDANSRLHVLFQTGGSTYTYCVVNPDGFLEARRYYEIVPGSRPRLGPGEAQGEITVVGGRRRPTPSDIPPYVPPPLPEATTVAPVDEKPEAAVAADAGKKGTKESRRSRRKQSGAE